MNNGISNEALASYAADILDKEADIEELQEGKKAVYGNLRDTYGKRTADALKLAVKRYRMDAEKLQAAEELDADAERFLTIIRQPRAPRATRTREIIEEFVPETGEVIEAPTPLPEAPVNPDAHVENASGAKTSKHEPSEPEGSGGVQDRCESTPPTQFEHTTAPGEPASAGAAVDATPSPRSLSHEAA